MDAYRRYVLYVVVCSSISVRLQQHGTMGSRKCPLNCCMVPIKYKISMLLKWVGENCMDATRTSRKTG